MENRGAAITIDSSLHPPGSKMAIIYNGDWSVSELSNPPQDLTVDVQEWDGRAVVWIDLPPAGMIILA
jgi:hypothetical protein